MKIGHKVPPHGGNGKLTGGNPTMRIHHRDGLNTDRTEKPVYSVGNYSFAAGISARIKIIVNISVTADKKRDSLSLSRPELRTHQLPVFIAKMVVLFCLFPFAL